MTQTTAAPRDWENPTLLGRNKEPGYATHIPFGSLKAALRGEADGSPYVKSLDGR